MALSITDLKNVIRLPQNWDLDYLKKFGGVDGTQVSFDELVRTAGAAFNLFNQSVTSGPWARYITPTTDLTALDDMGSDGVGLPEMTEYANNAPKTGDSTGHMLPMKDYGRPLAWTYMAIRRGTTPSLSRNIRIFVDDARVTWEKALLNRLFKSTYDSVGTGKSVPFADGGVADSDYSPPAYGGFTHASSHTHYLRNVVTSQGYDTYLAAAGVHLAHHGIMGPYDLIISEADVSLWAALDGTTTNHAKWIKPQNGVLLTTNVEVRAAFESGDYIGVIETDRYTFMVSSTNRLPTAYAGVFKPMGLGNPFNPLMVRYEKGFPLGLTLVQDSIGAYPLQDATGIFTFGVGVGNRLAGVPGYFAGAGSYTSPTIQ